MKVTKLTRSVLKQRREDRDLIAKGYRKHETDWSVIRGHGAIVGHVIIDAKVSADRKHVWTLVGKPEQVAA